MFVIPPLRRAYPLYSGTCLLFVVAHNKGVVDPLLDLAVLPLLGHGDYDDSLRLEETRFLTILGEFEDQTILVILDVQVVIGVCRYLRCQPVTKPTLDPINVDLRSPRFVFTPHTTIRWPVHVVGGAKP